MTMEKQIGYIVDRESKIGSLKEIITLKRKSNETKAF